MVSKDYFIKSIKIKYIKISSRKIRYVLKFLKKKNVLDIVSFLKFFPGKASFLIINILRTIINNYSISLSQIYLFEAFVNDASFLKRFRPRSQGKAYPIKRRFSHITCVF